jgi:hypothetical protein
MIWRYPSPLSKLNAPSRVLRVQVSGHMNKS